MLAKQLAASELKCYIDAREGTPSTGREPTMSWIDYRDIPLSEKSFSQLYVDYLTDFQKVKSFFPWNFRDPGHWKSVLKRATHRTLDRSRLVRILTDQNREFHCGVQTLANIDALHNDNTVAVVTGQQVGIFTGPLYALYKALTTIKLAKLLNERHSDYQFVPIFWLAGEDHDFDEVRSMTLIDRTNNVARVEYLPPDYQSGKNVGPVGNLQIDETIESFASRLSEVLPDTEFKPKVLDLLSVAYQKGMTLNRAFIHIMNDLLLDSGLIFLDSNHPDIKHILAPIFSLELTGSSHTSQLVIDRSAELERFYHAQVKPRSINLFMFHKNGRYLIEPRPEGFALKGTRQHFTREQMMETLERSPEMFSPNVILRPICQDSLLPTVAYVAGPAEIAYFAQLEVVYNVLQIPQPIIYPRASATIVEEKVQKVFERFSLSVPDFFKDVEVLKQNLAESLSELSVDEMFGGTSAALMESLQSLQRGLEQLDPTLVSALMNVREKVGYQIDGLKQKAKAAQTRRFESSMRQIEKAGLHLFPNSNFQERELNIAHFLNKYGLEFLRWLQGELVVDRFKHQVIEM
jgi:bacillithiol biosynthesis cysteine-adding enzyme BshC